MPLISVVLITYQHEKYIAEAIQSILDQTFEDFELIIVNDGSTDRTDEIIKTFLDNRITYIYQENQGPSIASNNGILASRGKYIALISGDDVCYPQRLEVQYKHLSDFGKKIAFSWIDVIDDDSQPLNEHFVQSYFNLPSRTRAEILNSFFMKGNDLCGVSVMAERQILLEAGLFNLASIQMQDFDMWIKIVKKYDISVIEEKLIKYRVRSNSGNLSLDPSNSIRSTFEGYHIYKNIFNDITIDLFKLSFSHQIKRTNFQEGYEYELEKAFLYLSHSLPLFQSIGVEKLFNLLQNEEILSVAKDKYEFGLPELYKLTKNTDITNIRKQTELQQSLSQTQSQLQQTQSQLQQTQSQLQQTQSQLQQTQSQLDSIQNTKFWKLRQKWFQFRRLVGITNDNQSLSFKEILKNIQKHFDVQKKTLVKIKQKKWSKNLPLVTVVIPCYNYGQYVEDAIDSVLNQTFQDFEIIVVDGGSTDDWTIKTLNSLQKPKTTIYYREGRHLVGDNRNFGIEKSQGKYICCLDADDKIRPTYLEKALFLLETAAYDIVSTSVQCFGKSTETWEIELKPKLEEIVRNNQISTVAVFSKDLWKKANGYHDYGIGKDHIPEDWDLWVRMMAIGARSINILEPLMLYRIHGNYTSLSNHPETLDLRKQSETIKNFNQKHLTQDSYKRSLHINQASYQVINGNTNISNSYLNEKKENKKTKIVVALPFTITGGADTVLLQIAKHLSKNKFDISVITTIETDPTLGDNTAKYENITKQIYHLYKFLDSKEKWKDFVYYYLESRQIEIILIVGSAYFYDLLPDIKKDFPHIKIVDQLFNEHGHIKNNRKYAKLIDMNILANKTIQNILLQDYKEEPSKTSVIVHGVDTQVEFNPANINQDLIENTVPKDKFIVSYMGRFSEEKCPQKFVDIANKLRDHEDIYFLMLGNGPEYELVKEQISKLNLNHKIYAPGFVEDNKPFLKASNLLIIPSKIEGIPIILMESLSLGVPVIAANVGGIPDVITDSYNGFVCNSGDINCFANSIVRVYSEKNLQTSLKENARSYAKDKLDIASMNSKYKNLFLSLTKKNDE